MQSFTHADQWFAEYSKSHQNKTNKLIHWFMVPAIYYSIFGLIWAVPVPELSLMPSWFNWAYLAMLVTVIFYFRLSLSIMFGMLSFTAVCLYIIHYFDINSVLPVWKSSLIIFVVAWIFQAIGHMIEGRKPSFIKNILFLLIGPAWLMGFIYRRIGIHY